MKLMTRENFHLEAYHHRHLQDFSRFVVHQIEPPSAFFPLLRLGWGHQGLLAIQHWKCRHEKAEHSGVASDFLV